MAAAKKSWFLVLFSLPFAATGIGILCFGIMPIIYDWYRMQTWQPVDAHLTMADVEINRSDDSIMYKAIAGYRYIFAGKDYVSERVAIESGGDNIGRFQEDLGYSLKQAYQQQKPIRIWVNPEAPTEAIIDRSLRLSIIGFKMIFVITFGGFGCGLLYFCLRKTAKWTVSATPNTPWLTKPEWATNRITSNQKTTLWFAWIITAFWNLISFPVLFVIPRELADANYLALIAIIFPVVGLGFLYWAIRVTRDWRRFGEVFLQLDPFPGSVGGDVGGTLVLPPTTTDKLRFYIQLTCINSYESGSGKNRESHERMIWQDDGIADAIVYPHQATLNFLFRVPGHLPASEEHSDNYHHWRLSIESKSPDVPFFRHYSIPVYATAQRSKLQTPESSEHQAIQVLKENALEAVCKLQQIPGGVELYFHPLRNLSTKLALLLFGIIFGGSGFAMLEFSDAPIFLSSIFLIVGGLCIGVGVYSLSNSLRVRLGPQYLHYQRRLFGVVVKQLQVSRQEILRLELAESYSAQTGSKYEKIYAVKALLTSGKKINIAESLRGQGVAELMLETLHLLCGIAIESKKL